MEFSYSEFMRERSEQVTYEAGEHGVWVVLSADTNPDYNGSHATHPLLVVSGTYRQAVESALPLKEFYCYGYGEIRPIDFIQFQKGGI